MPGTPQDAPLQGKSWGVLKIVPSNNSLLLKTWFNEGLFPTLLIAGVNNEAEDYADDDDE